MKHYPNLLTLLLAAFALVAVSAQAQTDVYKANNNDALQLGTSWTNGVPPGALDTAIWDSQVSTAANCNNTLGSTLTLGGLRILNPAADVKVTGSSTINVGSVGIDLNEPTTTRDLALACSLSTQADQNWAVGSGRMLTIGDASRNVNIQNNVTFSGHITYVNNLRVQSGGTLNIGTGTTFEPAAGVLTGSQLTVGNDNIGVSTVNQTGGVVKYQRTSGTTGSPATALVISSASSGTAVYNLVGGSLTDISPLNTARTEMANGTGSTATLNIDGSAVAQFGVLRLANAASATATVNVTNGTVTVTGSCDVGRTTSAVYNDAIFNAFGGLVTFLGTVNVPHGNGPGHFNVSGGNVFLSGSMNLQDSGSGDGTLTVSSGSLTVTNDINVPDGGSGSGTVNLDGGTITVRAVAHPSANSGTLNFNGGTLAARMNRVPFIASGITANVNAGGARIDTAGYDVTIAAALLNGGGTDGGLIKSSAGALTLAGADTYNGPTLLNGGSLYLTTTNHGGGSITAANATLLNITRGAVSTTLNCSALTLGTVGASSGGILTNSLDFGDFADPAVPVINAGSLQAAGTVYFNINASSLGVNTYHLIQYSGTVSGSDFILTNGIISGAVGYITNNTSTHYVDLVVTALPQLVWRALVNTNWDTTTPNWVDVGNTIGRSYPSGAAVIFDDSTSNALVYATGTFFPASVLITNPVKDYTFVSGGISGSTGLTKQGAGTVTMGMTNNNYDGDTLIAAGTFKLGASGVIPNGTGKGDVTVEGKLDMAGFNETINGLNGTSGLIDNSGGGAPVLTVGNGAANGTFAGLITNSTGSLSLSKTAGALTLLSRNGYSGGTINGSDMLALAYEQSIGTGPLQLNGGTLAWLDTVAHTLTNPLTVGGSTTFGASTNGPLTVTGTVNFNGGSRGITCNSDVLFANGLNNGGISTKAGPGTLRVKNNGGISTSTLAVTGGTLLLDNAALVEDGGNVRVQCQLAGSLAHLVVTNGASITTINSPSTNFRVGDSGDAAGVTNVLDVAGTITVTPYAGTGNKFQMGGTGGAVEARVTLWPDGVLRVRQVADNNVANTSIFTFNGGTLSPNTNDLAVSFMGGLDFCYIDDGGAVIDTAGWSVTISQQMQAGGTGIGGLTKTGAGTLTLDQILSGFSSTYSGPTVVNGGTLLLGANEPLSYSTNIVVGTNASLDISSGSFSLNGRTLQIQIGKQGSTLSSGEVLAGAGTMTYDGVLTVTRLGDSLTGGETFKLFDAAGGYFGVFTATNLPALTSPLSWDLSGLYLDGTIKVAGSISRPTFSAPALLNGTNLVMSGTGGPANTPYYVISSTNVAKPLMLWDRIATNMFNASGQFQFTNPVSPTVPRSFFDITY